MKNKIEIIENFLSFKLCKKLIDFFENNTSLSELHPVNYNRYIMDINITGMKEFSYLFNKINKHVYSQKCKIDWIKIVKWTDDCSQQLHFDRSKKNYKKIKTIYSSIMYLNSDYLGGQTFFEEGLIIKPIKGKALFFNGMYYKHGVMPVKKGPRYTLAAWYKNIKYE
tara:strand:+ start:3997 stop:4497 length:501 start_codon:yes stop_codon:yes gene_type:complete